MENFPNSPRLLHSAKRKLFSFCGLFLLVLTNFAGAAENQANTVADEDDGWRRTAGGWEHVSTWVERPVVSSTRVIHPLQLAFLQGAISVAGLWLIVPRITHRLKE